MDHRKMTDEELGSLTIEITKFSRRSVVATWHRSESNKAKLVPKQTWWSRDDQAWHISGSKPGLMGFTTHDGQAMVKRWSSGDQTMLARRSHSLRSSCETSRQRRRRELLGGNQEITLWALNSPERRFIIILWCFCTTTAQLKRQKRMEQEFVEGKHRAGQWTQRLYFFQIHDVYPPIALAFVSTLATLENPHLKLLDPIHSWEIEK